MFDIKYYEQKNSSNFVLDDNRLNLAIQRRNAFKSKYGESAFRHADVLRENCWNFCEKTDSSKTGQQKPEVDSRKKNSNYESKPEKDYTLKQSMTPHIANRLPIDNPSQMKHIFAAKPGHLPDTPKNRSTLVRVANTESLYLGTDRRLNRWYAEKKDRGQYWAEVNQKKVIWDGGYNETPRLWNPETGLKRQLSPNDVRPKSRLQLRGGRKC